MPEYKKICIIVADEDEFKPLADLVTSGKFSESEFLIRRILGFQSRARGSEGMHCGVGKVNAAAAAAHLADEGCEIMLNYGLSGGISRVRRGDICVCTRFLEHDFDLSGIGYRLCEKPGQTYIYEADEQMNGMLLSLLPVAVYGNAVTGDCFVNDGELREKLKTEFDAVCCDMETAAVAYVCAFAGIPFASVRRISDDAGADALLSYREMNSSGETVLSDFILECARAAARL